jgi:class 3 adenylate cyclase
MTEPAVERRVITALFVDVVGSTELTSELGPERLKRVLDRAFTRIKTLITAEGGVVEKYVGDAVYALFGAPTAHADDPQRALRAAHACLRLTDAGEESVVELAVRIGLETPGSDRRAP